MQDFSMLASTIVGALAFYLGAPSQRWLRAPLSPRISQLAASIFLVLAFLIAVAGSHPATALSIMFTTAMAVFVACPFIGALLLWVRPTGDPR
jgi:hypothetical protein